MLCAIQLFCYVTFPAHSAAGCVDWGKVVKRRFLLTTESSARGLARIDTVPNFKLRCLAPSFNSIRFGYAVKGEPPSAPRIRLPKQRPLYCPSVGSCGRRN